MAVTTDGLFQYILNRVLCLEPRPLRLEYRRLRSAATLSVLIRVVWNLEN